MPPSDMEVRITGKVANRGLMEEKLRAQGLSVAPPRQWEREARETPSVCSSSNGTSSSTSSPAKSSPVSVQLQHLRQMQQPQQQPHIIQSQPQPQQHIHVLTGSPHKVEQPAARYATLEAVPSPNKTASPAFGAPMVVTRPADTVNGVRAQPVRVLVVVTRQQAQQQQQQQQVSPDTRRFRQFNGQQTYGWSEIQSPQQNSPQKWSYTPTREMSPTVDSPPPTLHNANSGFNPFARPFVPRNTFDATDGLPLVPVSA
eukprot:Hpha_TRINITY_DN15741_c5_g8::TRINITY_DN15741_c5_g8_i1::g.41265::m.41265